LVNITQACEGIELQLFAFLNLAPSLAEWLYLHPGRIIPREIASGTHLYQWAG